MEREKTKADELEASLTREEKILEDIRDSLKGSVPINFAVSSPDICVDKTQVYHDQIEVKQKELQPWTAKINTKQAEIDVATSERDTLAKKAAGLKEACKEAQTTLEKLREDHQSKVQGSFLCLGSKHSGILGIRIESSEFGERYQAARV